MALVEGTRAEKHPLAGQNYQELQDWACDGERAKAQLVNGVSQYACCRAQLAGGGHAWMELWRVQTETESSNRAKGESQGDPSGPGSRPTLTERCGAGAVSLCVSGQSLALWGPDLTGTGAVSRCVWVVPGTMGP